METIQSISTVRFRRLRGKPTLFNWCTMLFRYLLALHVVVACSYASGDESTLATQAQGGALTQERYDTILAHLTEMADRVKDEDAQAICDIVDELRKIEVERNDSQFTITQKDKTKLILKIISTIDSKIDKTYDPNDLRSLPSWNVSPPDSNYPPGISPDQIVDDKIRENYEKEIKKNAARIRKLNSQLLLRMIQNERVMFLLFQSIGNQADVDGQEGRDKIEKLIDSEVKNDELRKLIRSELKRLNNKYIVRPDGTVVMRPSVK